MKKFVTLMIVLFLLAGCAAPGVQEETEAAKATEATEQIEKFEPVESVVIEVETDVKEYDLTGDGVADAVRISCLNVSESGDWGTFGYHWQLLINGAVAMEIQTDWPICPEAELYRVSEDRVYLAICQRLDTNDDMDDFGLYQYLGGKLQKVCDFYCSNLNDAHVFHYGAEVISVSGDRIRLRCQNQFNATAYIHWDMEFEYLVGTWAATGKIYPVVYEDYMEDKADGMTANQSITVYTSTACAEIAYTVEKGGILFIDQLCIEAGQVYFHVTNEAGREGWLKDPEEVYANIDGQDLFGYFEEAMFAG